MRRRAALAMLVTLPALATAGDDAMPLTADATEADQRAALEAALLGQDCARLPELLLALGAREALVDDLRQTGLPAGTEVAPGLRAGDPVLTAIFGLRRGFLRPDLRLRIYVACDAAGRMAAPLRIERFAK